MANLPVLATAAGVAAPMAYSSMETGTFTAPRSSPPICSRSFGLGLYGPPMLFGLPFWDSNSCNGMEGSKTGIVCASSVRIACLRVLNDTTHAALIGIIWYLCKYPEHAKKIRAEVKTVDFNDVHAIGSLPHLDGVVRETLRLCPPAMTGGNRITGSHGLVVDRVFIPPRTKVTAPKYVIHRSELESVFAQANEFIPERWYSQPALIKDKAGYAPFSHGARYCLGKAMAYAELRLVTAILLKNYDISFTPGYDEQTMWRDMRDQVTYQPGEVSCVFKARQ
ncbi:cytochrome P450 [Xylariaceae sp. FL0255]|nr:cytochrome P450 [Xylariaceae sp. FL0255]